MINAMYGMITLLLSCMLIKTVNELQAPVFEPKVFEKKVEGALFAAAIGDALGRVTEFIDTEHTLYTKYPQGVSSFNDLRPEDWGYRGANGVVRLGTPPVGIARFAPYTDDTYMALIVLEVMLNARKQMWTVDQAMNELARRFVYDWLENPDAMSSIRAVGNACVAGCTILQERLKTNSAKKTWWQKAPWWDVQQHEAGGCGSIMRAWPIGIVYYDNLPLAEEMAVAQSRLTHGHPWAIAASAAIAVGMGMVMRGADMTEVVHAMHETALRYDKNTAHKIIAGLLSLRTDICVKVPEGGIREIFTQVRRESEQKMITQQTIAHFYHTYQAWRADDALVATLGTLALAGKDIVGALKLAVNTPGADSDSIAHMAGALLGGYNQRDNILLKPLAQDMNEIENKEKLNALVQRTIRTLSDDLAIMV